MEIPPPLPLRPMMHQNLIKTGLFQDNSGDYFLTSLPPSLINSVIFPLFVDFEHKGVPFEDVGYIKWLMNLFLFVISSDPKQSDSGIAYPIALVAVNKFYRPILKGSTMISKSQYNEFVRISFLHLSLLFEFDCPDIIIREVLPAMKVCIIEKSPEFETQTWETVFKVIISLCDASITSQFKKEISESLFQFCFRLLNLSLSPSLWQIFNDFCRKWPKDQNLFQSWLANFNFCFSAHVREPLEIGDSISCKEEDATKALLFYLANAQILTTSENYGILHHAFGTVCDYICQKKTKFSSLFQQKWFIDEVFEIFSSWPLASGPVGHEPGPDDPRANSIISFVALLEQGAIRTQSTWFAATVKYFKRELKYESSYIVPILLPRLGRLLCSHPSQTLGLIPPIMKCFARQLKFPDKRIKMSDPILISMVISISEVYLNRTDQYGTIVSVQRLLPLLFDRTQGGSQVWQLHILLLMIAGCNMNDALEYSRNSLPSEYFVYLMFLPYFFPCFLKSQDGANFICGLIELLKSPIHLDKEVPLIAFFYTVVEIVRNSSLFSPNSREKQLLAELTELKSATPIVAELSLLVRLSSLAKYETAQKNEMRKPSLNFRYFDSILSFYDEEKLEVVVRNSIGAFSFEIEDLSQHQTPSKPIETERGTTSIKNASSGSSMLEGAFTDSALMEDLSELINSSNPITFEPYCPRWPGLDHPRIASFLTNNGILSSENSESLGIISEDLTSFFYSFDSIPQIDTIEIGVIHFTPSEAELPGCSVMTAQFQAFLDAIGTPTASYTSKVFPNSVKRPNIFSISSMKFVYLARAMFETGDESANKLDKLHTLIIFNETGCDCIEQEFTKLKADVILSVVRSEDIATEANPLYTVGILKFPSSLALPIIHKIPLLISTRNVGCFVSLIAALTEFLISPQSMMANRKARKEAVSSVSGVKTGWFEVVSSCLPQEGK